MKIRFALNTPDLDAEGNPLHEAEEIRQRAWEDFVALLRNGHTSTWLRHAADLLDGRTDPYYGTPHSVLTDFAAEHGWPDTLRAIAQALQADEREKRELFDRR